MGSPNDVHPAPHFCSIHSQHSLVLIVGLFYPLIKQNMAHLYLNTQRHYQQNNTLSSIFKLKIRTLSFAILFILFLSSVYTPPPTPLVLAAPKQNKTLAQPSSQTQSSRSKKKKKKPDHYFLSSCFLKINHLEREFSVFFSFFRTTPSFLFSEFFFSSTIYTYLNIHMLFNFS